MSVSAVGSSSVDQTVYAAYQLRKQAFKTLSSAMQSNDLAGAQKALSILQHSVPSAAQNASGPISADLAKLGSALNAGDMTGAQKAFSTLTQDMRNVHGHHGHHGGNNAAQSTEPAQVADNTTAPAVGGSVNLQA